MRAFCALLFVLVGTLAPAGCVTDNSTCPNGKQVYSGLGRATELAVGPGQYRDGLTHCSPITGERYLGIVPRRVGLYSLEEVEQHLEDRGWSNGPTGWTHPDVSPHIHIRAFTEVIVISWTLK
jgi:hypothetical protein